MAILNARTVAACADVDRLLAEPYRQDRVRPILDVLASGHRRTDGVDRFLFTIMIWRCYWSLRREGEGFLIKLSNPEEIESSNYQPWQHSKRTYHRKRCDDECQYVDHNISFVSGRPLHHG